MPSPTSSELRKWIPPQTRTSHCSFANCSMLANLRVIFGSARSLTVNGTLAAPGITSARIAADAPATIAACEGYSGCIGVAFSDAQPASRSVASQSVREREWPRDFLQRLALGGNTPAPHHAGGQHHEDRAQQVAAHQA